MKELKDLLDKLYHRKQKLDALIEDIEQVITEAQERQTKLA